MSWFYEDMEMYAEEILGYVAGSMRHGLDRPSYEALANELRAAAKLPPPAAMTAMRVALSKYPQTREIVHEIIREKTDYRPPMRGEWLDMKVWESLLPDVPNKDDRREVDG
jgi:hypothetical protein